MRNFIKKISYFLTVCMLVTLLPARILAEENVNVTVENMPVTQQETKRKANILGEVIEKRERNVKHFLQDNLSYNAAIYPYPVHYLKDGKWVDIDNTLIDAIDDDNNSIIENKENDFKIKFSKKADAKKLVRLQKEKYELIWGIERVKEAEKAEKTDEVKKEEEAKDEEGNKLKEEVKNGGEQEKTESTKAEEEPKTTDKTEEVDKSKEKEEIKEEYAKTTEETRTIEQTEVGKQPTQSESEIKVAEAKIKPKKTDENLTENEKKKSLDNILSAIEYTDIFPSVDLEYKLHGDLIKENIIIKKKVDNPKFTFNISVTNLIPKLQKDNSIIFYDDKNTKKAVFKMDAPFMYDALGEESSKIEVNLVEDKKSFTLE